MNFPEIDWEGLRSVYGWPALQYQFWARGSLDIKGTQAQTVALFGGGLLEFWVDDQLYFGGDMYQYRRAPSILRLSPGHHVVDLRLTRDVRAFGALFHGFDVVIDAELRQKPVTIDKNSLLISELTQGKLGGRWASINVQNNEPEPVDFISIHSSKVCDRFNPPSSDLQKLTHDFLCCFVGLSPSVVKKTGATSWISDSTIGLHCHVRRCEGDRFFCGSEVPDDQQSHSESGL